MNDKDFYKEPTITPYDKQPQKAQPVQQDSFFAAQFQVYPQPKAVNTPPANLQVPPQGANVTPNVQVPPQTASVQVPQGTGAAVKEDTPTVRPNYKTPPQSATGMDNNIWSQSTKAAAAPAQNVQIPQGTGAAVKEDNPTVRPNYKTPPQSVNASAVNSAVRNDDEQTVRPNYSELPDIVQEYQPHNSGYQRYDASAQWYPPNGRQMYRPVQPVTYVYRPMPVNNYYQYPRPGRGFSIAGLICGIFSVIMPFTLLPSAFMQLTVGYANANGDAVSPLFAGFVSGFIMIVAVLSVVFSILGGSKNNQAGLPRGGVAIAGQVLGIIGLVLAVMSFFCVAFAGCTVISLTQGYNSFRNDFYY